MRDYWVTPDGWHTNLHTVFKNPARPDEVAPHAFWTGTFLGKSVALQGGRFEVRDARLDSAQDPRGWDIFQFDADGSILYWGTFRGNHPGPAPREREPGDPADFKFGDNTMRSHAFESPVRFMHKLMAERAVVRGFTTNHEMSNWLRKETNAGLWCYQVKVVERVQGVVSPVGPPLPLPWSDVLKVTYHFGDCRIPGPGGFEHPTDDAQWQTWAAQGQLNGTVYWEDYWLQNCKAPGWEGKACGTVYFKSYNAGEPSGVDYQFAADQDLHAFEVAAPSVPWYDPFSWQTHVQNGFFEDGQQHDADHDFYSPTAARPCDGGTPCWSSWRGWSGIEGTGTPDTEDVVITNENPLANPPLPSDAWTHNPWYAALRKDPNSGWDLVVSQPIDVQPGEWYRLSGWLYKSSASDDVYLDFDDMEGYDNISTTQLGWSFVSDCRNVPAGIGQISVRCVRDHGEPGQNAQCDGVTLQHVLPGCGGGGGGDPDPPGGDSGGSACWGGAPNGVCDGLEETWVIVDLETGEVERGTTCPEDCKSCGMLGGTHCSDTHLVCPGAYSVIDWTYDCPGCCEPSAPPPTCGQMGGDHCSQTGACPQGYTSMGPSSDCNPCCDLIPLPTCGSMGGNYCSQTGSCPQGYDSLGLSSDCNPCCKTCVSTGCPGGSCGWQLDNCGSWLWCGSCLQSCGQMGGDYCSQWGGCPAGYNSLGVSSDCNPCCQQGPSCGAIGGNYCSQDGGCPEGAADYGQTHDCNHCCAY